MIGYDAQQHMEETTRVVRGANSTTRVYKKMRKIDNDEGMRMTSEAAAAAVVVVPPPSELQQRLMLRQRGPNGYEDVAQGHHEEWTGTRARGREKLGQRSEESRLDMMKICALLNN